MLDGKVLVLNKSWQTVDVICVKRAIKTIFKHSALIVDSSFRTFTWDDWVKTTPAPGEPAIHSTTMTIRIPKIVLLKTYDKTAQQRTKFNRVRVMKRDKHLCQYCLDRATTIDHIVPRAFGGKTCWENCVACCLSCNGRKGARTPEQADMKLRSVPGRPKFFTQSIEEFLREEQLDTV